jgi:ribosomal protein S18 acetylase RimI-like enzyme
MQLTTELGGCEAAYLALEAHASEPYTAFVYEDRAEAERVQRLLFDRDAGDLARGFARLAMIDGRPAGMLACIPGDQLVKARLKAALVLRKAGVFEAAGTARRSSLAGQTLAKIAPDDFYLSRIAVAEPHRGQGIGKDLLLHYEAEGRRLGARRLVLEVSPRHPEAIRLYERAGFAITGGGEAEDAATHRRLAYHHMTKQLAG